MEGWKREANNLGILLRSSESEWRTEGRVNIGELLCSVYVKVKPRVKSEWKWVKRMWDWVEIECTTSESLTTRSHYPDVYNKSLQKICWNVFIRIVDKYDRKTSSWLQIQVTHVLQRYVLVASSWMMVWSLSQTLQKNYITHQYPWLATLWYSPVDAECDMDRARWA